MTPLLEVTDATTSLSLDQLIARPSEVSTLLAVSRRAMVGCTAAPTVIFCVLGVTTQLPIGISVTMTFDAPTAVPDDAEMTAPPAARATTLPFWSTDAVDELLDAHVTERPVITVPEAFLSTAVN